MTGIYAIGATTGDRTFSVSQSGATEWQITGDNGETGYLFGRDSSAYPLAYVVDESGAEGLIASADMWTAVRLFAHVTRTVEATPRGRELAARWQSSGTVGSVLATIATTGRARVDMLANDAQRTVNMDAGADDDMRELMSDGIGEPVTVRSIVADVLTDDLAQTLTAALSRIVADAPHLISDAESARLAVDDILTAHENHTN